VCAEGHGLKKTIKTHQHFFPRAKNEKVKGEAKLKLKK